MAAKSLTLKLFDILWLLASFQYLYFMGIYLTLGIGHEKYVLFGGVLCILFISKRLILPINTHHFSLLLIPIIVMLLSGDLWNKTHASICLFIIAFFSRSVFIYITIIIICFFFNSKMALISTSLLVIYHFRANKFMTLFLLLLMVMALYKLTAHWYKVDLDKVWTIQNRLIAWQTYLEYISNNPLRAFFPLAPSEIYPRALDVGILVGITRYGILGFLLFLLMTFSLLSRHEASFFRRTLFFIPIFSQAFIFHPLILLLFTSFLIIKPANNSLKTVKYNVTSHDFNTLNTALMLNK